MVAVVAVGLLVTAGAFMLFAQSGPGPSETIATAAPQLEEERLPSADHEEKSRDVREGSGEDLQESERIDAPEPEPIELHDSSAENVEGGLDREVVERVVRRHHQEIRMCYERELHRDPSLQGRIVVEWVVDGNGRVMRATIRESSIGSSSVEACITQRVRLWRFPEPRGGGIARVTYRWSFSP